MEELELDHHPALIRKQTCANCIRSAAAFVCKFIVNDNNDNKGNLYSPQMCDVAQLRMGKYIWVLVLNNVFVVLFFCTVVDCFVYEYVHGWVFLSGLGV